MADEDTKGKHDRNTVSILEHIRENGKLVPASDDRFHYPEIEKELGLSVKKTRTLLEDLEKQEILMVVDEAESVGCSLCNSLSVISVQVCPICGSERIGVTNDERGLQRCGMCDNVFYFPRSKMKCQICKAVLLDLSIGVITAKVYGIGTKGTMILKSVRKEERDQVTVGIIISIFLALIFTFGFGGYIMRTQERLLDTSLFVMYSALILSYLSTSYYLGRSCEFGIGR